MKEISLRFKIFFKENKIIFFIFPILFFVHIIWLLAFYPGLMSHDSVVQWEQAVNLHLNDTHPYLHTLYFSVLIKFFDSPATIAVVQIFFASLIFSLIFSYFYEKGIKKMIVFLVLLYCISIPIGLYTITLWKDIPFSLALIGLSFFLYTKLKYDKLLSRWKLLDWLIILLLSVIVIYFRHNGIIYLLFIPLLISFYFIGLKQKIIFSFIIVCIFFLLNFIVPHQLSVTPKPFWSKDVYIYHSMVGFYVDESNAYISEESKMLLEKLIPGNILYEKYTPLTWNPIYWGSINEIDRDMFNSREFWTEIKNEFFIQHLFRNLDTFLLQRFELMMAGLMGMETVATHGISKNDMKLYLSPLHENTYQILLSLAEASEVGHIKLIVWNSLVPLLMLVVLFVYSIIKKNKCIQVYTIMLLISLPFLFIFNVDGDWRYYYFYYLSLFISIPMISLEYKIIK